MPLLKSKLGIRSHITGQNLLSSINAVRSIFLTFCSLNVKPQPLTIQAVFPLMVNVINFLEKKL